MSTFSRIFAVLAVPAAVAVSGCTSLSSTEGLNAHSASEAEKRRIVLAPVSYDGVTDLPCRMFHQAQTDACIDIRGQVLFFGKGPGDAETQYTKAGLAVLGAGVQGLANGVGYTLGEKIFGSAVSGASSSGSASTVSVAPGSSRTTVAGDQKNSTVRITALDGSTVVYGSGSANTTDVGTAGSVRTQTGGNGNAVPTLGFGSP